MVHYERVEILLKRDYGRKVTLGETGGINVKWGKTRSRGNQVKRCIVNRGRLYETDK